MAQIDADEENNGFHGRVINISDVVNFKGKSMAELKKEFARSMEIYFDYCRENGGEPEQPFTGRFILRVDPAIHRAIARAADSEGKSINTWAKEALAKAAAG